MMPTDSQFNSTSTGPTSAPSVPASDEVRAEGAKKDAFLAFKIAKEISAHTGTVVVTERGEQKERRLSSTAKLLAYVLAQHWNTETGQLNPGNELLARELGVPHVRVVTDAVHLLKAFGFLNVQRGQGWSAQYQLVSPSDPRKTAGLHARKTADRDQRKAAHLDRRKTADPYRERPKAEPSKGNVSEEHNKQQLRAAVSGEEKYRAATAKCKELAALVREHTGRQPKWDEKTARVMDELACVYDYKEIFYRAEWVLCDEDNDGFWADALGQRLNRFIGGFEEIRRQMTAAGYEYDDSDDWDEPVDQTPVPIGSPF